MLVLAVLTRKWANDNGVAYCLDQADLGNYDVDRIGDYVALLDVHCQWIWDELGTSLLYYSVPVDEGREFILPLWHNNAPAITVTYDSYDRRYIVYPRGYGEVARRKRDLKSVLEWARYLLENRHLWDTLANDEGE